MALPDAPASERRSDRRRRDKSDGRRVFWMPVLHILIRHGRTQEARTHRQALVERYPREKYQLATKNAAWINCKTKEEAMAQFDTL